MLWGAPFSSHPLSYAQAVVTVDGIGSNGNRGDNIAICGSEWSNDGNYDFRVEWYTPDGLQVINE